ncbi:MAG TPA: protein kinase [Bacteroidota bacterium]|jgi:serine/threonine protein kinase|nr:protein kinase [Bacteroidota bacterium]
MIGQTISHYKILEKLGEGGMGVVYKAEDSKLDRTVALKFLPPHLSASEQDKIRFVQEAKAAAALNHPNVCSIIDIQEHDGQIFIVMEFVDGQTLREKRGTISFKQAVDVGIQIADGLAAAHEKGIVHRDIKPENIMVRKDGIVQIMDFGLAKLRSASSKINRLTKEGSTVGTAGYMSPEQVQGQDVDHRSDIFSLGILLYELFTGELPFKGVHETALLYEIVNVDVAPMSAIKPEIEPELDRIVLECLDKDPNERTQAAKQVSIDLKRFKRESSRQHLSRTMSSRPALRTSSAQQPAQMAEEPVARSISKRELSAWIIAGVVIASLGYVLLKPKPETTAERRTIRSSIVVPDSFYIHSYGVGSGKPVLSPDGKFLVFEAIEPGQPQQLVIRSLSEREVKPIPGTEGAASPFWSPDGKMIGFFQDGKMKKVDLTGGSPVTIAVVPNQRGAAWCQGDVIVYCPDFQGGLFQVSADGKSAPQQLTTLDSARHEGSHRWPFALPDGKHVLYLTRTAVEAGEAEGDAIFAVSLDGKEKKMLVQSSFNPAYAEGYLLFARNQTLMAQRFDPEHLALSGEPIKVEDDLLNDPSYNIAVFTASNNGLLVYQSGTTMAAGARPIVVDRTGKLLQTIGDNIIEQDHPRFSPDGKQLAMYMYDLRSRRSNIWIHDLQTNGRRRITTRPEGDFSPLWSPDGATIYFTSGGIFNRDVYRQSVSHSSKEELVYGSPKNDIAFDISPDGTTLLIGTTDVAERQGDLFLLKLNGGGDKNLMPFQTTKFNEIVGRFSHDGKWIAFVSDESGENEVYVKQVARPDSDPIKISTGGGIEPRWGMGANELIFGSQEYLVAATLRLSENSVSVDKTTRLLKPPPFTAQYDVSRDGKTIVFSRSIEMQKMAPLTLVGDWAQGLGK